MSLWYDKKGKTYASKGSSSWVKCYTEHWANALTARLEGHCKGTAEKHRAEDILVDSGSSMAEVLDTKVDKIAGMGLSHQDYTSAEKEKLSAIAEGATSVGTPLPATGAEAFNDSGNTANIPYAHIEGLDNHAALKGFYITSYSANTVILDSVDGIEVGMPWYLFLNTPEKQERYTGYVEAIAGNKITVTAGEMPTSFTPSKTPSYFGTFIVNGGSIGSFEITDTAGEFSCHIEGHGNEATLDAHAEGTGTKAYGYSAHAEGRKTNAIGQCSHAEGYGGSALRDGAHVEGASCKADGSYSHAEGYYTETSAKFAHSEGWETKAQGDASHAEGYKTEASGDYSHAEGNVTTASGDYSHAEGNKTEALGGCSHAEGNYTDASGNYSHAEGYCTVASGDSSHAEGYGTAASNIGSHAEGYKTEASGSYSHAEGNVTTASGDYSHAEGNKSSALKDGAHAEGIDCKANGDYSHAEGGGTETSAKFAHSEGWETKAQGDASHAEGRSNIASGAHAHAEGYRTTAEGSYSHAEGSDTIASGESSHSEGSTNKSSGRNSHAEGSHAISSGDSSHAEGISNTASNGGSHAEGFSTRATAYASHAEGVKTTASGTDAHAEGDSTVASAYHSHAEGQSTIASGVSSHAEGGGSHAKGDTSHAEGLWTIAAGNDQHVEGKYNKEDADGVYAHIVGNGTSTGTRSNAYTLDWVGNGRFAGKVYSENSKELATKELVVKTLQSSSQTIETTVEPVAIVETHNIKEGGSINFYPEDDDDKIIFHSTQNFGVDWFDKNNNYGGNIVPYANDECVANPLNYPNVGYFYLYHNSGTADAVVTITRIKNYDTFQANILEGSIKPEHLSEEYYSKAEVDKKLGDIQTALDSISAIQESLMGGESA